MDMTLTLGSGPGAVTLYRNDLPDDLPLPQEATGSLVTLSDGFSYPRVTGISLPAIQIKGTLYSQRDGTPLQTMHRLLRLQAQGKPVRVRWHGDGVGESFVAVLRRFDPHIVRNNVVDYTLDLERSVPGALLTLTSSGLNVVTPSALLRQAIQAAQTAPGNTSAAAAKLKGQLPPPGH